MRVTVLGAGGMLGQDLVLTAPEGIELSAFSRRQLDITDTAAVRAHIAGTQPQVILNAAAYTAVDDAEDNREATFRVNGAAVGELGHLAAHVGARVVHFSTGYVFDGRSRKPYVEDAPTHPLNTYGASKLAGELALGETGVRFLVLRTQWLFGAHGRSFPRTMWERATRHEPTRVVSDQTGRPTYTVDLARAAWELVRLEVEGVLHVANSDLATWYDVASCIFSLADSEDLVTPCTTEEYPVAAQRPRYSVLDTTRAERILGHALPTWRDAIQRFLREAP